MRIFYIAGWGYIAIAAMLVYRAGKPEYYAPLTLVGEPIGSPAQRWFQSVKPRCNSLETELTLSSVPPPAGLEGAGYAAACLALAGKIDAAQKRIDALPADDRWRAAGIVFEIGHPVADAGDDQSAGPIMELVLRYWPNHYMALYHAGMAQYRLAQHELARQNLDEFLRQYKAEDGWTARARSVLREIAGAQ